MYVRVGRKYGLANLPDILVLKRVHAAAAFRFGFPRWRAYRERVQARWRAWRCFSCSPIELPYVAEPLWRYAKSIVKQLLPNTSQPKAS